MYKEVTPIDICTQETDCSYLYPTPRKCPVCDNGTDAEVLSAFSIQQHDFDVYQVFILFFCHHCESCFMGVYQCFHPRCGYQNQLVQMQMVPRGEDVSTFSEGIGNLSQKFVEIYNQAELAEQWGLSEICGMGYRKALEFLVKDFAIKLYPEQETEIKSSQLSNCIREYIDNKRINSLAKASAWIGNDETHYVRKHDDYNTDNLKTFITAMASFIDSELAAIDAEKLINPR